MQITQMITNNPKYIMNWNSYKEVKMSKDLINLMHKGMQKGEI